MKTIGTAELSDFNNLINWFENLTIEEAEAIYEKLDKMLPRGYNADCDENTICNNARAMYNVSSWASYPPERTKEYKWPVQRSDIVKKLRQYETFATDLMQPVNVGWWAENEFAYLFFGNPKQGIVIPTPEKYIVLQPLKDYSEVTPAEVRAMLNAQETSGARLVPTDHESMLTKASLGQTLETERDKFAQLEQQAKDIKEAKTEALAKMKAEIDKKVAELETIKKSMMAELDAKKKEMEEKLETLQNQIFLLDSQIYSICCYAGEVVQFGQIRKGKNAPDTEPIVVHQKLRFLDEDLGRIASLYEINWGHIDLFEHFLKHHPLALETFAPNERCITLVRMSRTGKTYGRNDLFPYSNILKQYEYYHGKTVGIIIRNGESLYLGWTDEERIDIADDLIVTSSIDLGHIEMPEFTFESERERFIKEQKANRKKIVNGIVSRVFIYSVLQGIVDRTQILPLPEGVKLNRQSEYVLYAVADHWLADNQFGSFNDIIEKCNNKVNKGDMVLTVQQLRPEQRHRYNAYDKDTWENPRGRGDRNRTRDCEADDCTIYPVNLVEYDEPVKMVTYEYPGSSGQKYTSTTNADRAKNLVEGTVITGEYERIDRHVFISVLKEYSMSGTARSNFELYESEYVNLTYMNSVWLSWVVNNKKLGDWRVGGESVDYAYAIRYLNTAMDFIRKREAAEKDIIDDMDLSICKDPKWPLKLTEWKLENEVRAITLHQAKRFARYYQNNMN